MQAYQPAKNTLSPPPTVQPPLIFPTAPRDHRSYSAIPAIAEGADSAHPGHALRDALSKCTKPRPKHGSIGKSTWIKVQQLAVLAPSDSNIDDYGRIRKTFQRLVNKFTVSIFFLLISGSVHAQQVTNTVRTARVIDIVRAQFGGLTLCQVKLEDGPVFTAFITALPATIPQFIAAKKKINQQIVDKKSYIDRESQRLKNVAKNLPDSASSSGGDSPAMIAIRNYNNAVSDLRDVRENYQTLLDDQSKMQEHESETLSGKILFTRQVSANFPIWQWQP